MNQTETDQLLEAVCRTFGGFAQWRDDTLHDLAAISGMAVVDEAVQFAERWELAMSDVDLPNALKVLQLVDRGELQPVPYGQMTAFIRTEAKRLARPQFSLPRSNSPEHKAKCGACLDTGSVETLNPRWIDAHLEFIAEGLPAQWFASARRWCRDNDAGPFRYAVACNCEAAKAVQVRIRDWLGAVTGGDTRAPRPSRCQLFDPRRMIALRSYSFAEIARQLEVWIKNYDPNAAREWHPEPYEEEAA